MNAVDSGQPVSTSANLDVVVVVPPSPLSQVKPAPPVLTCAGFSPFGLARRKVSEHRLGRRLETGRSALSSLAEKG